MLPLSGLRVLDLSRLLPGPYCTLLLADLGAQVIKVEEPAGGDYLRHMPPMARHSSALFLALNRNKRSLALDLRAPAGAAALNRLVKSADVLVESFRPGTLDRLGLGYEALSRENPRLIVCSLSGWGRSGPLKDRAGHDLGYAARSGVLGYGGDPEAPAMPGAQVADIGGALCAATAILAAVHERERTGRGRAVDVSLFDSSLPFFHMQLGARLALGDEGSPLARGRDVLNGGYPCYRIYRTKDGRHLAVAALEPKFWEGFCRLVGRQDWADSGWRTGEEGARIVAEVAQVIAGKTQAEWEALLRDQDLCIEPVREGDEILAEPQIAGRGLMFDIEDDKEGRAVRQLKTPLFGLGEPPPQPAPGLGEHTRQVLVEAGFSDGEIAELLSSGVVVQRE